MKKKVESLEKEMYDPSQDQESEESNEESEKDDANESMDEAKVSDDKTDNSKAPAPATVCEEPSVKKSIKGSDSIREDSNKKIDNLT